MSISTEETLKKPGTRLKCSDAVKLAKVLDTVMCDAGYYDNWDKIISDMFNANTSKEVILDFAENVRFSVDFINKFGRNSDNQITNNFYVNILELLKRD